MRHHFIILVIFSILLSACTPTGIPTPIPLPTALPKTKVIPSSTPYPTATHTAVPTETPTPVKKSFKSVHVQPQQGSLSDILNSESHQADQLGLHPFVEFYADWCPSCQDVIHSMNDSRMIDAFEGTYIIHVNVDDWKEQINKAGFDVSAIPAWAELDTKGVPTGNVITGEAWGDNIPENMAPPLKAFFNH